MTPAQYTLLADITATAVYVRAHDRRAETFGELADEGLIRVEGTRAVVTEAGVERLRGMGR